MSEVGDMFEAHLELDSQVLGVQHLSGGPGAMDELSHGIYKPAVCGPAPYLEPPPAESRVAGRVSISSRRFHLLR